MQISAVQIDEILARAEKLPSLPGVVRELMHALSREHPNTQEVAHLLAVDQSLAARALKLANSAYYSQRSRIATVQQAVAVLGFSAIRAIVLGATIYEVFNNSELEKGYFDATEFWRHSIGAAAAAENLARMADLPNHEDAFTAGLLHGVGLLILDQFMQPVMKALQEMVETENLTLAEAEEELLGFDHAHLGARLLEQWFLPARIVGAVRFHHYVDMAESDHLPLAACVHVGQIMTRMLGHGNPGEPYFPRLHRAALKALGLNADHLSGLIEGIDQAIGDARVFLPVGAKR